MYGEILKQKLRFTRRKNICHVRRWTTFNALTTSVLPAFHPVVPFLCLSLKTQTVEVLNLLTRKLVWRKAHHWDSCREGFQFFDVVRVFCDTPDWCRRLICNHNVLFAWLFEHLSVVYKDRMWESWWTSSLGCGVPQWVRGSLAVCLHNPQMILRWVLQLELGLVALRTEA